MAARTLLSILGTVLIANVSFRCFVSTTTVVARTASDSDDDSDPEKLEDPSTGWLWMISLYSDIIFLHEKTMDGGSDNVFFEHVRIDW